MNEQELREDLRNQCVFIRGRGYVFRADLPDDPEGEDEGNCFAWLALKRKPKFNADEDIPVESWEMGIESQDGPEEP